MIYTNLEDEGEKNQPVKPIEGEKRVAWFHIACAVYTVLTKTNEIKRDQEKPGKINKTQEPREKYNSFRFVPEYFQI